jgi:hypothetical protein
MRSGPVKKIPVQVYHEPVIKKYRAIPFQVHGKMRRGRCRGREEIKRQAMKRKYEGSRSVP